MLKNIWETQKAFLTQFTSWASATMWLYKKNFFLIYFEVIIDSEEVTKNREVPHSLSPASSKVNIIYNYITISKQIVIFYKKIHMPKSFYLYVTKQLHLRICLSGIDYKDRNQKQLNQVKYF